MHTLTAQALDRHRLGELVSRGTPVVIEFWGPWCGPCRAMAPLLDDASAQLQGAVTIGKVDISADPELAVQFGVMSVPTLVRLDGGVEQARHHGAMTEDELMRFCVGASVA